MKGLFIPEITAEMFRNGCLEGIEALMAEGEIYDIDYTGWIPVSERLPDACNEVLLTCEVRPINHKPSKYVCTAQWIPKFCKEALSINWDEEATEYCEEDDEFYPHEGWYESISNWGDYSLVGISDFAIAWMPLPKPYREDGEA